MQNLSRDALFCTKSINCLQDIRKDRIIKECNEPLATGQENKALKKNLLLAGVSNYKIISSEHRKEFNLMADNLSIFEKEKILQSSIAA